MTTRANCAPINPNWAQRLDAAGYRTGYVGKWHVERSNALARFGWQTQAEVQGKMVPEGAGYSLEKFIETPGYRRSRFYGVTAAPMAERGLGRRVAAGLDFLDEAMQGDAPWCCFVSVLEPHDPFICGEAAFAQYDVDALPLSASLDDDLAGRPGLYRKSARVFADWTEREHREAAACYYASVTEIDQQFARLIERVERAGQMDDTIIVLTSDHGELLGAHGLYCKNVHAGEEIYNIPLLMAGPGIAKNATTSARVGLHDLAQTCSTSPAATSSTPSTRARSPQCCKTPLPTRATLPPATPSTRARATGSPSASSGRTIGNSSTTALISTSFTIWPTIPTNCTTWSIIPPTPTRCAR